MYVILLQINVYFIAQTQQLRVDQEINFTEEYATLSAFFGYKYYNYS
jgi:hypothetical protein